MRISVVITVFNEEESIGSLLDSLARQTKKLEELIIVDGGSTDDTVNIIEKNRGKFKKLRLFVKKGFPISRARNFGIKRSNSEIIVSTDAGCFPHLDWFEQISTPFERKSIDVVSGFYDMTGRTVFQECIKPYFGVPRIKIKDDSFLPSARSMAFRKYVWKEIGGFSERLDKAGEDTLFNYHATRSGYRYFFQEYALVDWEVPRNFSEAFEKFFSYAMGDYQTKIWWDYRKKFSTHTIKIISIYLRYLLFFLFLFLSLKKLMPFWVIMVLFFGYLAWSIQKNFFYIKLKGVKRFFIFALIPIIQVYSDFGVMLGFANGLWMELLNR
ncbi:glycosyltransferase [Patescibacteria group bacterium]